MPTKRGKRDRRSPSDVSIVTRVLNHLKDSAKVSEALTTFVVKLGPQVKEQSETCKELEERVTALENAHFTAEQKALDHDIDELLRSNLQMIEGLLAEQ